MATSWTYSTRRWPLNVPRTCARRHHLHNDNTPYSPRPRPSNTSYNNLSTVNRSWSTTFANRTRSRTTYAPRTVHVWAITSWRHTSTATAIIKHNRRLNARYSTNRLRLTSTTPITLAHRKQNSTIPYCPRSPKSTSKTRAAPCSTRSEAFSLRARALACI